MTREKPRRGLRLGRIAGIEIGLDWSLLIILWLLAAGLAFGVLPGWHPEWNPLLVWTVALLAAVLFFASVTVHELAHALVGRRYGIGVKRITLFVFGGIAHMESEPKTPRAELLMAIAGPITSLLIGFVATALGVLLGADALQSTPDTKQAIASLGVIPTILLWLGPVNILLALFNMVPGFPLDGGRVFRALAWSVTGDLHKATRWASALGQGFAWLLMGTGVLMAFGVRVPIFGTGLIPGLWLVLIGWFVNTAARVSYQQLVLQEMLQEVPVAAVMRANLAAVQHDVPVTVLVRDYAMNSDQPAYPVLEHGDVAGIVRVNDVSDVPYERWDTTRVADIATSMEDMGKVDAEATAREAFETLQRQDADYLAVVHDGDMVGFVGEQDIMKWIALRTGLSATGRPFRVDTHGAPRS